MYILNYDQGDTVVKSLFLPILFLFLPPNNNLVSDLNVNNFAEAQSLKKTSRDSDWDLILQRYIIKKNPDGVNLFNYAALSKSVDDLELLNNYLTSLEGMDPNLMLKNDAIAYYANLYNAVTVKLVTQNYKIKSIRKLGPLNSGPWKRKVIKLNTELVSLDDIEHKILRSKYKSPYIHYMLNCASMSCPNLQVTPWKGDSLEVDQLAAATEYINSSRAVTLKKNALQLSSIYKWFKEDFENEGGVLDHILKHANKDLKNAIEKGVKIKSYNYDWTLNDVTDN
jgi:hypothetical protein